MSKNSKKVIVVNSTTPLNDQEPLDDRSIQAPKGPAVPQNTSVQEPAKQKRPMTEAQKAVLAEGRKKGREKINQRNAMINQEKQAMQARLDEVEKLLKEQKDKEFEEKLVKKAVAAKKKQIKREAVLDQISDDDTNIEEIKAIKKRTAAKKPVTTPTPPTQQTPAPQPSAPKYTFV
jgi:type IV secretory pathway VirJ component